MNEGSDGGPSHGYGIEPLHGTDFGQVVQTLKSFPPGAVIAFRSNWNGIRLDGAGSMFIQRREFPGCLPVLSLTTPAGEQVPWLATSTDIFGDDWTIAAAPADVRGPAQ